MSEPKEWIFNPVCKYRVELCEDKFGLTGNEVHVIEKSAYDALQEELNKELLAHNKTVKEKTKLEAKLSSAELTIQALSKTNLEIKNILDNIKVRKNERRK